MYHLWKQKQQLVVQTHVFLLVKVVKGLVQQIVQYVVVAVEQLVIKVVQQDAAGEVVVNILINHEGVSQHRYTLMFFKD